MKLSIGPNVIADLAGSNIRGVGQTRVNCLPFGFIEAQA
jgi:hypothetical protein